MTDDFISELEGKLSKVGSTKVWKRKISGVELWISPITVAGQDRLTDVMSKADELGAQLIGEVHRWTIANAVVGVDNLDLRKYRDVGPCLPSRDREGKPVNVTLERYLYDKISGWSATLLVDAFTVYTDVSDIHQRENLAEVKFDSVKDPAEELKELEARVAELRRSLGRVDPAPPQPVFGRQDVQPQAPAEPMEVADDPFQAYEKPVQIVQSAPVPRTVPDRAPSQDSVEGLAESLSADLTREAAAAASVAEARTPHPQPAGNREINIGPKPIMAYQPNDTDTLEQRSTKPLRPTPPVVDPKPFNRNPRFSPPGR